MTPESLAGSCVSVLSVPVRSVILHGSLATGDFVPGVSDIDLLIVVDEPLHRTECDALVAVVRAADPAPAGGIDLHVVLSSVAAAPGREPAVELLVGRHAGEDLEVGTAVAADADLPAELSMARAGGRALAGAAPAAVLGVVDPAAIHERSAFWLRHWLARADDVRHGVFMVVTACRMWHFRVEGTHASKSAAGAWALRRDPSLIAVRQALTRGRVRIEERDVRAVLQAALSAFPAP